MFVYSTKTKTHEKDFDVNDLISQVKDGLRWYTNKQKPELPSIMNTFDLTYNDVATIRKSDEYREAVELYILDNGLSVSPKKLGVGIKKKNGGKNRHPDAEKHVVWGKLVEETDTQVIIEKLPDIEKERTMQQLTKEELIEKIKAMKGELDEAEEDLTIEPISGDADDDDEDDGMEL